MTPGIVKFSIKATTAIVIAIVAAGCALNQPQAARIPGWRIYTPPPTPSYPLGSIETPLSQWTLASDAAYTTELDCERGAKEFSNKYEPRIYDCIANDDPRLRGKRPAQVADSDHAEHAEHAEHVEHGDPRFPLTQ